MRKKLFLTVFAVCIGIMTFAQNLEPQAKEKVEKEIGLFMDKIKNQKPLKPNCNPQQQFFIEKGKPVKYGKKDKEKLDESMPFSAVWAVISDSRIFEIENFTYEPPKLVSNPKLEIKERTKRKTIEKDTIGYILVYEIAHCKTKLSCTYKDEKKKQVKNTSEADYAITMTYFVGLDNDNKEGVWTLTKEEIKLKSITVNNKVTPKSTSVDTLAMYVNNIANERIQNWYKTSVPSYFESKINGDVVTYYELVEQSDYNKKVQKLPTISVNEPQKTVTITKTLPAVKLHVDSTNYMSQDSLYEKDPNAYYVFAKPSFKITFSDDYKTVSNFDVDFGEPEFKAPKSDDMVEVAKNKATSELDVFESDFQNKLQAYLKEPNADNTKALTSLFKDGTKVEVSIVSNSGNTKRTYSIDQYISRVKGAEIFLDMDKYQFSTENATDFNSSYINYTKNYKRERENYCDST